MRKKKVCHKSASYQTCEVYVSCMYIRFVHYMQIVKQISKNVIS